MPTNIVVPEVGESIVDARVAKWLRKEGDAVAAGDPLVELETDKIDLEVSATTAGVIARIDRRDGDDVKVGEVLGVIEESKSAGPCGRLCLGGATRRRRLRPPRRLTPSRRLRRGRPARRPRRRRRRRPTRWISRRCAAAATRAA
jgi:pyruvate/2-oxoglutarate dehydrogenase complex dihydrolipoamide acyltransferase (E2) component